MNDLLPISATPQERALSLSTERVADVPVPQRTLWDPDTCPVDLLPWLAWTLSVETWNPNWSESIKRAVVKASIETHRKKGTVAAVKAALAALGASCEIVEWWETDPTGTPHTFDVNLINNDTSVAMQNAMVREINRTKPLRSHFDIIYGVGTEADINIVCIVRPAIFVRLDGGATY